MHWNSDEYSSGSLLYKCSCRTCCKCRCLSNRSAHGAWCLFSKLSCDNKCRGLVYKDMLLDGHLFLYEHTLSCIVWTRHTWQAGSRSTGHGSIRRSRKGFDCIQVVGSCRQIPSSSTASPPPFLLRRILVVCTSLDTGLSPWQICLDKLDGISDCTHCTAMVQLGWLDRENRAGLCLPGFGLLHSYCSLRMTSSWNLWPWTQLLLIHLDSGSMLSGFVGVQTF